MATIDREFNWENSETPRFDPVALLGVDVVRDFGLPRLADWRVCCSEDGRPLKAAAPNGEWREYRYDAEARLVEIQNQSDRRFTFLQSGNGNSHPWVAVLRGEEPRGSNQALPVSDARDVAEGTTTTFTYDAEGRCVAVGRS